MTRHLLAKELNFAKNTAQKAGEIALRFYHPGVNVEIKPDNSPVTKADQAVDEFISSELYKHFPDDAVLSEESPSSQCRRTNSRLWCVDPIDGTKEFIAQNGDFVVMIGLAIEGEAALGVVYQPTTQQLVWGCDGESGVMCGDETRQLRVAPTNCFEASTVVVSRNRDSRVIQQFGRGLGIEAYKPIGSLGLKLVELALGRAEVYLSFSSLAKEWDTCAPEAILRAAGGMITDGGGMPLRYNKEDISVRSGIVATNGVLHQQVLQALPEKLRRGEIEV